MRILRFVFIFALIIQPIVINSYMAQEPIIEFEKDWLEDSLRVIELNKMRRTNDTVRLIPEVQKRVKWFLYYLKQEGLQVRILETYRHPKVQDALYAQGRNRLSVVNDIRRQAGLSPIRFKENYIITYAKGEESTHSKGLAFDFIPIGERNWEKIGKIGERCGFTWGGRWKQKDLSHFEYRGKIL